MNNTIFTNTILQFRQFPVVFILLIGITFAQSANAQHYQIRDNAQGGDCVGSGIGAWNAATKTCTLGASLTGSISIEDNDVKLDGGGLQLRHSPGARAVGVMVQNRQGVTVRRLQVHGFDQGIVVMGGSSNTLEQNVLTGPQVMRHGILLESTVKCKVINNNRVTSATDAGIWLRFSTQCRVEKSILSLNAVGIMLTDANLNTLEENFITGTGLPLGSGIQVLSGNDNWIVRNNISGNGAEGVFIGDGNRNLIFFNQIQNNTRNGLTHMVGTENRIYCNDFKGHNLGVQIWDIKNHIWWNNFYANDDAENLIGGSNFNMKPPTGGNFWNRNSPNCIDANGDQFCDLPYAFAVNQDKLPHVAPIPWVGDPNICTTPGQALLEYDPWEETVGWYTSLTGMVEKLMAAISSGDPLALNEMVFDDVTLIDNSGVIKGSVGVLARLAESWFCGEARPRLIAPGEPLAQPTVTEIEIERCDRKISQLHVTSRFLGEDLGRQIESLTLIVKNVH